MLKTLTPVEGSSAHAQVCRERAESSSGTPAFQNAISTGQTDFSIGVDRLRGGSHPTISPPEQHDR
jgi:hypothetical protein